MLNFLKIHGNSQTHTFNKPSQFVRAVLWIHQYSTWFIMDGTVGSLAHIVKRTFTYISNEERKSLYDPKYRIIKYPVFYHHVLGTLYFDLRLTELFRWEFNWFLPFLANIPTWSVKYIVPHGIYTAVPLREYFMSIEWNWTRILEMPLLLPRLHGVMSDVPKQDFSITDKKGIIGTR